MTDAPVAAPTLSLSQAIQRELRPERLVPTITASLVIWVLAVILAVAFAALIFSGDTVAYVPFGVGLILSSTIVVNIVIPLLTKFPATVSHPQDTTAAFLAGIVAALSTAQGSLVNSADRLVTIVAGIVLASLLTAITLFLLGQFRLGALVRFIPYPVIGGFLAGTGWLLLRGAIGVVTGITFDFARVAVLFQPNVLIRWLPGIVFAVVLIVMTRRFRHYLVMPSVMVVGIVIFYGIALVAQMPLDRLSAEGWLLGPFPEGGLWHPMTILDLQRANWTIVFGQLGNMIPLLIMAVLTFLLNESGLEVVTGRDVDLNYELKVAGAANLVSGLLGGMGGFGTLALTALSHRIGSGSRLVSFIVAALCLIVLLFGATVISYFPKPILGGFLMFLGLGLLLEWVIEARAKLPRSDYLIVITILLVIMFIGFLEALLVGLVVAAGLFLVNYSRVNVVRSAVTGDHLPSTVDRTMQQQRVLHEKGKQIFILRLQGYIFFGTANSLLEQVRHRAENAQLAPRFVVFDFRLVSGMDSSALLSFTKIKQQAQAHNFKVVFTDLPSRMQRQMEGDNLIEKNDAVIHVFADLDHGLEWAESQLLDAEGVLTSEAHPLPKRISDVFPNISMISQMLKYMERLDVPADITLITQDKVTDGLYFIESGHVTVNLTTEDGKTIRLRALGGGIVVGEVALYMDRAATASVITSEPSVVYHLSADAIAKMQADEPAVATAFHTFMARLLAERLVHADHRLQGLLD